MMLLLLLSCSFGILTVLGCDILVHGVLMNFVADAYGVSGS